MNIDMRSVPDPKMHMCKIQGTLSQNLGVMEAKRSFPSHQICTTGWRCSVVVSMLASIKVVNRHWVRLVAGRVTVFGRVNHLGM